MTNQSFNYQLKTTIHAQENGIANIPTLFARLGAKRVVLFSDQGLKQLGYIEKFSALFEGQYQVELVGTYTDIEPDATCDNINAAISYAHSVQADAILSVGGGSVIDASKGVKYAFHKNINDIRSIIAGGGHMEVWPNNQDINIPHIAVPTTAGTGAEASPIAVFFNEHENIKASLVASGLEADIAVLDPTLTTELPAHLTRSTAMDALTHAVEAIVSPMSNSFTDAYGIHAAKLIVDNLPLALEQPDNLVARANLLQASTMAISAFYASLGGIPIHNCAHAFGAISHIPHGDANTVLMPIVIEALPEFYVPNAHKLAAAFSLEISGTNEMAYQRVLGFLREFQVRIGAMQRFSQWSFDASIKQEIAQAIEKDISFQFYPMTPQAIANIIDGAV